jgi:hypothetical protein
MRPETVVAMFLMLSAGAELSIFKGVACRYGANPRSWKVCIGELQVTVHVCDTAWGLLDARIDASSCVFIGSQSEHRTSKPVYKDPWLFFTPSRLQYIFNTCVALNRLVRLEILWQKVPSGDEGDVMCALPKGWLPAPPDSEIQFTVVGSAVLDGVSLVPPTITSLNGESVVVVGKRYDCCLN